MDLEFDWEAHIDAQEAFIQWCDDNGRDYDDPAARDDYESSLPEDDAPLWDGWPVCPPSAR